MNDFILSTDIDIYIKLHVIQEGKGRGSIQLVLINYLYSYLEMWSINYERMSI